MTHQSAKSAVSTIGIDIGKNTFHLIGMDASGAIFVPAMVRLWARTTMTAFGDTTTY